MLLLLSSVQDLSTAAIASTSTSRFGAMSLPSMVVRTCGHMRTSAPTASLQPQKSCRHGCMQPRQVIRTGKFLGATHWSHSALYSSRPSSMSRRITFTCHAIGGGDQRPEEGRS